MGLYDRDYMRGESAPEDEDGAGMEHLAARRRKLLIAGLIAVALGAIAMWLAN